MSGELIIYLLAPEDGERPALIYESMEEVIDSGWVVD